MAAEKPNKARKARGEGTAPSTEYLVLALQETSDKDPILELWTPIGTQTARTAEEAIRLAAKNGSGDVKSGTYWAIPARSASNRLVVKTQQVQQVSYEKPSKNGKASAPQTKPEPVAVT